MMGPGGRWIIQGWVDEEEGMHKGYGKGVVREAGEQPGRVLLWKTRKEIV